MNHFEKPDEGGILERTPERMAEIRNFIIKDLELTIANLGENLEGEERYIKLLNKQLEILNEATPEEVDKGVSAAIKALDSRVL